jgi:tetratricopeptide (TPR) repeat protein
LKAERSSGQVSELPESIDAMVVSRIDRLPLTERRMLRFASVLGMSFDPHVVDTLFGDAASLTDRALWRRLDDFVMPDEGGSYRFRHALMRDAAYQGLSYRRRRELHGAAGDAILAAAGSDPDAAAGMLSLHFLHAQRFAEAWRSSVVAGDRARQKYANQEAAIFYQRAIEAGRRGGIETDAMFEVLSRLGDVQLRTNEFPAAGAAYAQARKLVAGRPVDEAEVLRRAALVTYRAGSYTQCIRLVRRALATLDRAGPNEAEAAARMGIRLRALYGAVRVTQGKYAEAETSFRRVIAEAEGRDELDPLARAYYLLDFVLMDQGRVDEAVHSQRAAEIFEQLGDLLSLSEVLANSGGDAYEQGKWREAIELYDRARDLRLEIGDVAEASICTANISEILIEQGRLEAADGLLREALLIARASEYLVIQGFVLGLMGRVAAQWGRFDDAEMRFRRARELFEQVGIRPQILDVDARMAELLLLRGEWGRSLFQADRALRDAAAMGGVHTRAPMLHRIRGLCLMQRGEPEKARAALEQSLATARARAAAYEVAQTLSALARLDRLEGLAPDPVALAESRAILDRLDIVSLPGMPIGEAPVGAA